jgi:hypothetical protein
MISFVNLSKDAPTKYANWGSTLFYGSTSLIAYHLVPTSFKVIGESPALGRTDFSLIAFEGGEIIAGIVMWGAGNRQVFRMGY